MSAQPPPNPPLPPLPNLSFPPPPTLPTPPPAATPPPTTPPPPPQPEPEKPPTNSPQPAPRPDPAPTNPPAPLSPSPAPPPTPPTLVITSVDTHIIPTIITSTLIRVTNTADGSSTSTLVGIDSHGSLVPIPFAQTASPTGSNKPATSGSPSVSSAAAENAASTGMSNAMLAMVVAVPLSLAFFIAIAVTLLRRRSDLKRYHGGMGTRSRRPSAPPEHGSAAGNSGQASALADAAVDSPLISIAPPLYQDSTAQSQEYAPVPQSHPTRAPNQLDSNVYLDPEVAGGYYQSHPPPSPTASSTSASGGLFVAPGPPRVVDPSVPMLAPVKHAGAAARAAAAPRRASNLRYSFNGQASSDAAGSLVAGMDEGVQFSKTPRAETGRLS